MSVHGGKADLATARTHFPKMDPERTSGERDRLDGDGVGQHGRCERYARARCFGDPAWAAGFAIAASLNPGQSTDAHI
jgi:hypothetical protein